MIASALGTLLSPALAVALASAQPVSDPRDMADAMERATAAGDVDTIVSLYAGDALILAPDGAIVAGSTAIADLYRRNQEAGPNSLTFEEVRIDGGADRAVILWAWTLRIEPPGATATVVQGRSLLYLKYVSSRWLIIADMFQTLPTP